MPEQYRWLFVHPSLSCPCFCLCTCHMQWHFGFLSLGCVCMCVCTCQNIHNIKSDILTIFAAYSSMALIIFTLLCNRPHAISNTCSSAKTEAPRPLNNNLNLLFRPKYKLSFIKTAILPYSSLSATPNGAWHLLGIQDIASWTEELNEKISSEIRGKIWEKWHFTGLLQDEWDFNRWAGEKGIPGCGNRRTGWLLLAATPKSKFPSQNCSFVYGSKVHK